MIKIKSNRIRFQNAEYSEASRNKAYSDSMNRQKIHVNRDVDWV